MGLRRKLTPLERRARRMLRRGFDVPPSREGDFKTLLKAGYTVAEAGQALRLE